MAEELKILKRERNVLMSFRLTAEEAEQLKAYRIARGATMSEVIVSALVQCVVLKDVYCDF